VVVLEPAEAAFEEMRLHVAKNPDRSGGFGGFHARKITVFNRKKLAQLWEITIFSRKITVFNRKKLA
jgi:hypothetical protein